MKIKLNNKQELEVLRVDGSKKYYQNANRDALEFVFEAEGNSLDEISTIFGEKESVRQVVLTNEDGSFVHEDYIIKESISLVSEVLEQETSNSPVVTKEVIKVSMLQQTYTEKLIEQLLNR